MNHPAEEDTEQLRQYMINIINSAICSYVTETGNGFPQGILAMGRHRGLLGSVKRDNHTFYVTDTEGRPGYLEELTVRSDRKMVPIQEVFAQVDPRLNSQTIAYFAMGPSRVQELRQMVSPVDPTQEWYEMTHNGKRVTVFEIGSQ